MAAALADVLDAALRERSCTIAGPSEALDGAGLATFGEAVARRLRQCGTLPDEPVVVLIANRPADIGALLGTWRAGAVAVPVSAAAPAAVRERIKAMLGARFTIEGAHIEESGAKHSPRDVLQGAALVIFTSGSTGRPKGVVIGHERFAAKLEVLQRLLHFRPDDAVVVPLQLTFIYGLWVSLLAMQAGARLLLLPRFSVSAMSEALASGTTVIAVVPTMLRSFPAEALPPAPALKLLLTGGEPFGAPLAARIGAAYPQAEVFDLYGSTETGSCDFCLHSRDPLQQGTIGTPTEGVAYRIAGGEGRGPGEIGELCIKTPYGMLGYLDDPGLTAAAFVDDYFKTGDLARVKADGMVELVGRRNDIISRGGVKIAPLELDFLFAGHPEVEAALCGAMADERLGQSVHVLVVPRKEAKLRPEQLREWAAERLERLRLPDAIHFVKELPVGATGKADRGAVSRCVAASRKP